MKIKKILFSLALAGFVGFVCVKLYRIDNRLQQMAIARNPFSPTNIACDIENNPQYDIPLSNDLITFVNVLTQQPFHWLAKGYQAYAFESQDKEFVIKFFQQRRIETRDFNEKPFEYMFSTHFREKMNHTADARKEIILSSKLAFEEIPEETGVVFIHLNRTQGLLQGIRVTDILGQTYRIKPDTVSFIIQRKAHYVLPTITEHMEKGDIAGAKARIDQIFDLLLSLAKKGLVDSDEALIRNNNIGFLKNRAIYIDTGHIAKQANLNVQERMTYEFTTRLKPLREWLKIKYPELLAHYDGELSRLSS